MHITFTPLSHHPHSPPSYYPHALPSPHTFTLQEEIAQTADEVYNLLTIFVILTDACCSVEALQKLRCTLINMCGVFSNTPTRRPDTHPTPTPLPHATPHNHW